MSGNWYYMKDEETLGPFMEFALLGAHLTGEIEDDTLVWNGVDVKKWTPLRDIGKLFKMIHPPPDEEGAESAECETKGDHYYRDSVLFDNSTTSSGSPLRRVSRLPPPPPCPRRSLSPESEEGLVKAKLKTEVLKIRSKPKKKKSEVAAISKLDRLKSLKVSTSLTPTPDRSESALMSRLITLSPQPSKRKSLVSDKLKTTYASGSQTPWSLCSLAQQPFAAAAMAYASSLQEAAAKKRERKKPSKLKSPKKHRKGSSFHARYDSRKASTIEPRLKSRKPSMTESRLIKARKQSTTEPRIKARKPSTTESRLKCRKVSTTESRQKSRKGSTAERTRSRMLASRKAGARTVSVDEEFGGGGAVEIGRAKLKTRKAKVRKKSRKIDSRSRIKLEHSKSQQMEMVCSKPPLLLCPSSSSPVVSSSEGFMLYSPTLFSMSPSKASEEPPELPSGGVAHGRHEAFDGLSHLTKIRTAPDVLNSASASAQAHVRGSGSGGVGVVREKVKVKRGCDLILSASVSGGGGDLKERRKKKRKKKRDKKGKKKHERHPSQCILKPSLARERKSRSQKRATVATAASASVSPPMTGSKSKGRAIGAPDFKSSRWKSMGPPSKPLPKRKGSEMSVGSHRSVKSPKLGRVRRKTAAHIKSAPVRDTRSAVAKEALDTMQASNARLAVAFENDFAFYVAELHKSKSALLRATEMEFKRMRKELRRDLTQSKLQCEELACKMQVVAASSKLALFGSQSDLLADVSGSDAGTPFSPSFSTPISPMSFSPRYEEGAVFKTKATDAREEDGSRFFGSIDSEEEWKQRTAKMRRLLEKLETIRVGAAVSRKLDAIAANLDACVV